MQKYSMFCVYSYELYTNFNIDFLKANLCTTTCSCFLKIVIFHSRDLSD